MITFDRVTKRYPDGTVAVDALDLETARQTVTCVGPSGCGKTTSLRHDQPADRALRGPDPARRARRHAGRPVPAAPGHRLRHPAGRPVPAPHIEDNIATVPAAERLGPRRRPGRRAVELMDLVGLDQAMARRYPASAVRRPAAARRRGQGAGRRPAGAADGRAVQRGRPDCPGGAAGRAHAASGRAAQDDRDGHARRGRGHQGRRHRRGASGPAATWPRCDTPERLLGAPADDFVEDFIGFDRGIRRLSFFSASGLDLTCRRDAHRRRHRRRGPPGHRALRLIRGARRRRGTATARVARVRRARVAPQSTRLG